jgi:hypothetical protein
MPLPRTRASVGLRAKTGRAIAVTLAASGKSAEFVDRREISLVNAEIAASGGPYHAVMELPWAEAQLAVRETAAAVERIATAALAAQLRELAARGFDVAGVGIVGSPDRRLETIGNFHIRAHAAEGILFRRVLEVAAAANGVKHQTFSDRSINDPSLADEMRALGRAAGPPWRADERAAATAAWRVLFAPR